jgi:hypothetical protein
MNTVKKSGVKVFAELGNTKTGFAGRDCVFMSQGRKGNIQAAVLFVVKNNKILKYDLCAPELLGVERNGIYPI